MDQLRALRRRARGEVVPLDERGAQAPAGGVERHAGAGDAAADDEHVEGSSARRRSIARRSNAAGTIAGQRTEGRAVGGCREREPPVSAPDLARDVCSAMVADWRGAPLGCAAVRVAGRAHRGVPGPRASRSRRSGSASSASCTATTSTRPPRPSTPRRSPRCRPSRCAPCTRRSTTSPRWARSSTLDLGTGSARFDPTRRRRTTTSCATRCGAVRDVDVDGVDVARPDGGDDGLRDRQPPRSSSAACAPTCQRRPRRPSIDPHHQGARPPWLTSRAARPRRT